MRFVDHPGVIERAKCNEAQSKCAGDHIRRPIVERSQRRAPIAGRGSEGAPAPTGFVGEMHRG